MSRRTGSGGLALNHSSRFSITCRAAGAAPPRCSRTMISHLGVALLLLAPVAARAAEVSFEASVDRQELGEDETLTLRIVLLSSEQPTQLGLPGGEMRDFDVVSRSQSSQTSFALGGAGGVQLSQTRTFALVLKPRRQGALVIPAATCLVGGKRYATSEITVRVAAAGKGPAPGQAKPPDQDPWANPGSRSRAWRGWERDLSIRLALDKKQVWLGEQVTASVYVMSPVEVVNILGQWPPAYDAFWAEDLQSPTAIEYKLKYIDGIPYRMYLLKKLALFPTRAGRLEIGPYSVELVVQIAGRSPLDFFPETRRVKRQSEPVAVEVKALPKGGVPPGFESTSIGEWRLSAEVSETRIAAGQPVPYRLTATGRGNLRSLSLPRLPAQAGLKAFDPTVTEKVALEGERFGGSKTVETIVVPERTGELVFPPLEWRFFSPKTGRYETARAPEVRVEVTPGAIAASGGGAPGANTLAAGLRPLRTEGEIGKPARPPWKSPLFAALLAGPILLYGSVAAADRVRERLRRGGGARRTRLAGRVARRHLERARKLASRLDSAGFHAEVSRALAGYAADKLGRPVAGLTREELSRALAEAGAHPPAIDALARALDACDAARYGRGAAAPEEVIAGAARAMEMLEEADWKRPEAAA